MKSQRYIIPNSPCVFCCAPADETVDIKLSSERRISSFREEVTAWSFTNVSCCSRCKTQRKNVEKRMLIAYLVVTVSIFVFLLMTTSLRSSPAWVGHLVGYLLLSLIGGGLVVGPLLSILNKKYVEERVRNWWDRYTVPADGSYSKSLEEKARDIANSIAELKDTPFGKGFFFLPGIITIFGLQWYFNNWWVSLSGSLFVQMLILWLWSGFESWKTQRAARAFEIWFPPQTPERAAALDVLSQTLLGRHVLRLFVGRGVVDKDRDGIIIDAKHVSIKVK